MPNEAPAPEASPPEAPQPETAQPEACPPDTPAVALLRQRRDAIVAALKAGHSDKAALVTEKKALEAAMRTLQWCARQGVDGLWEAVPLPASSEGYAGYGVFALDEGGLVLHPLQHQGQPLELLEGDVLLLRPAQALAPTGVDEIPALTSAEEFIRLRSSTVREEYWRAAHAPAPLAVWLDVIEQAPDMREWVAHNKTVPLQVLEQLARDPDEAVRMAVATKRKLTPELFALLAADPRPRVRMRLAVNAKAPLDVLQRLARDSNADVAECAQERLARLDGPPQ